MTVNRRSHSQCAQSHWVHRPPRAGLRHRPTRPWPIGPRGFRGPALSKVKELCRHSYSLSHEKSGKKRFGLLPVLCIRVCLLKREAVVTVVASHVAPHNILGLGPLKALIRPCVRLSKSALEAIPVSLPLLESFLFYP